MLENSLGQITRRLVFPLKSKEKFSILNPDARGGHPRSMKIAGVGARSAGHVWLLSGGGSHGAGMGNLRRGRVGLSAGKPAKLFSY